MDHLPIPEICKPQVHRVPYLGLAPKYDKQGIDEFPKRHGVRPDEIISTDMRFRWRPNYIESFLQEWLWFGLLDEFGLACGIEINRDEFIMKSTSGKDSTINSSTLFTDITRRVMLKELDRLSSAMGLDASKTPDKTTATDLNSTQLPIETLHQRLLASRTWVFRKQPSSQRCAPEGGRRRLAKCIARVQRIVDDIISESEPVLRFEISLSIGILYHSLRHIVLVVFGETIDLADSGLTEELEDKMYDRNWCPSRVNGLMGSSNLLLDYMGSLFPSFEKVSHKKCHYNRCFKRPLTINAMELGEHRSDCPGTCIPVNVKESELIKIWTSEGIPGVRTTTLNNATSFEVVDCGKKNFVAISHVWSHGLGNPRRNRLPSCQVKFLSASVKKVAGEDAVLWIDTLCVPIQPNAKRLAISKLRLVYAEAKHVLVIDKDLLRIDSRWFEQVWRLLSSEWRRRLWTLQEARLASDVLIQFRYQAVSVTDLMAGPTAENSMSNTDMFGIFEPLVRKLKHQYSRARDVTTRFQQLVVDLAPRTVTVRSDEAICIAVLLGLALENFPSYPSMVDVYRSFQQLPQDLPFLDRPRLEAPGLKWAPSSFLESDIDVKDFPCIDLGELSSEGILVEKDCIVLQSNFVARRDKRTHAEVYIINTSSDGTFAVQIDDYDEAPDPQMDQIQISRSVSNAAIIWMRSNDEFKKESPAILVGGLEEREGCTYCQFEMLLEGWRVNDDTFELHQDRLEESNKTPATFKGSFVTNARFCVG